MQEDSLVLTSAFVQVQVPQNTLAAHYFSIFSTYDGTVRKNICHISVLICQGECNIRSAIFKNSMSLSDYCDEQQHSQNTTYDDIHTTKHSESNSQKLIPT